MASDGRTCPESEHGERRKSAYTAVPVSIAIYSFVRGAKSPKGDIGLLFGSWVSQARKSEPWSKIDIELNCG